MTQQLTRAEHAKSLIESAYDLGSCGIGIQKQLVSYMLHNPDGIRNRKYLANAMQSGTQSNMIAAAGQFGRATFSDTRWIDVSSSLQNLGDAYPLLESRLFRTLAYGTLYDSTDRQRLSEQEVPKLFEGLATRGYFSQPPKLPRTMEKFLKQGFGLEFGGALMEEHIDFDYNRIFHDIQELMLGDAKKDSVAFHAYKLKTMARILDHAIMTFLLETGNNFVYEASQRGQRWKEIFDEDMPLPPALLSKVTEVVEETERFSKQ